MKTTLYDITGPWPGRLAIAPRPRGGDWLVEDIEALRAAGVDVLVSTLAPDERAELALVDEEQITRHAGLDFVSFPIEDRGVPASMPAVAQLVQRVGLQLEDAKTVAIHCRSGIGRSSLLAAAILVAAGSGVDAAFEQLEEARGLSVPDTPEQKDWVAGFARSINARPERAAS